MHSGKNLSHTRIFSKCKFSAGISVLFIFLMGFVFQGCVVHKNGHRHRSYVKPAPVTFAFNNHHRQTVLGYYHRHPHHHHSKRHNWKKWKYKRNARLHAGVKLQVIPLALIRQLPPAPRGTRYIYVDDQVLLVNVKTRLILDFINISVSKPAPRTVDRMPSYEEQHPSQAHQPPSHAQAHEVAQGRPFTEDEHPSSHGQGHQVGRGKPDMGDDHPSSQGQDHRMNKGKPDMGEDHPSQHAKNDRGHGQQADRGKPLWGDDSPSAHAKMDKGRQGGGPKQEMDRPSSMQQGNQGRKKGGPPEDKGRPSTHAQMDKGNRGGPQQGNQGPQGGQKSGPPEDKGRHAQMDKGNRGGPPKGHDRPSGKGKPSMESPMADDSGSNQMTTRGKPDKGKPKGKGKQKDRGSARGPSGQEDTEQFQPDSPLEENIQVAKVERGRGKGSSGKPKKMNRGKREQQTGMTAPVTQQEPATTASFAPMVFDSSQRSIIQSYYQNSGSKKRGKGRGKSSRGSRKNKTTTVSKNDILTQPTEPLPRSLESQLPPSPPNTRRVLYNQQVVLIEQGTNRVLDVINVNN